jgi:replicative superfamily II helicase
MRNVIILGIHRGMNEVEALDITQEIGRAGRVGLDPKGDAYILLPESKFEHYKKWCQNIPPITSTFNDEGILAFHVVSEICEEEVTDYKSLMEWYNRSLAAFQHDFVDKLEVKKMIEKLEKLQIIDIEKDKYKITKLGQVAAHLYFNPYSVAGWYFNFNKIFKENIINDYAISWALANISDNFGGYIPKEYKDQTESFMNNCRRNGLEIKDNPAFMGMVYYSCLTYAEGMSDFVKNAVKFDFERVSSALSMIDSRYANWGEDKFWNKLSLRIQYEVTDEQAELCTLKGIGGAYTRKLFNAGIKFIRQIKGNETAMKVLGKKIYEKVVLENNL